MHNRVVLKEYQNLH